MYGAAFCLVTAALGYDVGWQPLPDGGMEYIIQIEPHLLEMLKSGEQLVSDIPPNLRGVRSYRITVGTAKLPREGELPEPEPPPSREVRIPAPTEFVPPLPPPVVQTEPTPNEGSPAAGSASAGSAREVPATLTPPSDTRPLTELGEKAAAFVSQPPAGPEPSGERGKQGEAGAVPEEGESEEVASREPWSPSILTMTGLLFGSLGATCYVGWIAWDYRRQYRALLARVIESGGLPVEPDETTSVDGGSAADAV